MSGQDPTEPDEAFPDSRIADQAQAVCDACMFMLWMLALILGCALVADTLGIWR